MAGRNSTTSDSPRLIGLAAATIVVAALYFAQDFLIPVALAILFSFLLAPIATKLERWGVGRILSTIIASLTAFIALAAFTWIVTNQLVDLASKLPEYKNNIMEKARSLRGTSSFFGEATETLREIGREIAPAASELQQQVPGAGAQGGDNKPSEANPVPVRVTQPPADPWVVIWNAVSTILGPLGTAAAVAIFVVFILLQREDLRDRLLVLIGEGEIYVATEALEDAAARISRYLLMQLIVNASYGIPVAVGLYFIGVPNAFLWGLMATFLRYLPYIGPWICAAFPIALSLASDNWTQPILTISLFIVLELISNNVMEPWLYGTSTGISSVAVLAAAGFWTWLWGMPGLLLSTPLTVLLVVLGKHIPQMEIFHTLLSEEPVLEPRVAFYQRLLANDPDQAVKIIKDELEKAPLEQVYDRVILPAMSMAEADHENGRLDSGKHARLEATLRDVLAEVQGASEEKPEVQGVEAEVPEPAPDENRVVCIPASDEADEIAARMLTQVLQGRGLQAMAASADALASEIVELVQRQRARVVCISALPPSVMAQARYLCKRLHTQLPNVSIVIGLWTAHMDRKRMDERVGCGDADKTVTSLGGAVEEIEKALHSSVKRNAGKV